MSIWHILTFGPFIVLVIWWAYLACAERFGWPIPKNHWRHF